MLKNIFFSDLESFRFERKFHIDSLDLHQVEIMLKEHSFMFSEVYYERMVNNIYFDTVDFQHYFENINGVSRRLKVRIRWYGNLFGIIHHPTLELKLKHNHHVGKLLYPLKSFTLDEDFSINKARLLFQESNLTRHSLEYLKTLEFSLLNSYRRKYFLSANKKYRVTLDTNLRMHKINPHSNNFLFKTVASQSVIFELKYNQSDDKPIETITNYFPFRLTRSSKYAFGLERLEGQMGQ